MAATAATTSTPTKEQLLALYERMLLIRRMEERLRADAAAGNLPGAVHLYIGQEAVATGVCARLNASDWITSTHRGHGHFLAKGGDPKAMMAEIWGKKTGICKGMGGSMHVADFSKGILGANGIVGEYPVFRHLANIESVYTYEGTHDIHTLVLGQAVTGIPAYDPPAD